jgi:hypothetical protein
LTRDGAGHTEAFSRALGFPESQSPVRSSREPCSTGIDLTSNGAAVFVTPLPSHSAHAMIISQELILFAYIPASNKVSGRKTGLDNVKLCWCCMELTSLVERYNDNGNGMSSRRCLDGRDVALHRSRGRGVSVAIMMHNAVPP